MKKTNKGFSMVELIIVIAIMAILAGALAPALIKYINKSRISTDISNGQQIASAIQTALSNEKAFNDAHDVSNQDYQQFYDAQDGNMQTELKSILGSNFAGQKSKAKKDLSGNDVANQTYYVSTSIKDNLVTVYVGDTDPTHMVYPSVGASWSN